MRLPEAVRRQGEASDQLLEQYRKEGEVDVVAQADGPQATNDNAPPPAPQDTAPTEGSAPQQPAAQAPAQEPPKDRTDWKAKYHVLEGKYRAEVPRMAEEIRSLKAEIRELREKAQATPATPSTPPADDYRQKFDPELIDVIEKLAEQKAQALVGPVTQTVQKSAFEQFVDRVRKSVPDLDDIDAMHEFGDFMAERDVFSGRTRQDLLNEAAQGGDAERVIAFYDAFKSKLKGANPPPAEPPALAYQPPAPPVAAVVPPQSGSPGAPAPAKIWTSSEIASFYASVTKGHYRGREAQVAQIEAEIRKAHMEGRIR
jgi:hypothetical protein